MADKKYVSLTRLSDFLIKLKNIFATKAEVETVVSQKSQVQIITWGADD